MSEQPDPTPDRGEPLSLVERMGVAHLAELGLSYEMCVKLLTWRRAVRRGTRQVGGPGTEPLEERLRWQD